ncbi:hypothetical protein [Paraburkholderia sp. Cpub6]|uniref:hypothetical protein n=1 Tax=Paraburkholderia sp. Cpub6 TaxID=2723094 RepID=UPI001609C8C4|nr:hypothetical protein [Paraburkholderia sp. Cpub6]MBB5457799.1 hypothetical protein [Paraburkholderia sp. Cpub6]
MFDGFWSGVFGGLFGPAISRWLGRYTFWKVFVISLTGIYALMFLIASFKLGVAHAIKTISAIILTIPGFFAPVGIAAALAFCAFLGATSAKEKE